MIAFLPIRPAGGLRIVDTKQELRTSGYGNGSPGVFAAGDVRAGAMNRVASAVGEGSMVVRLAHEYLALT